MTTLIAICGQPLVHALGWTLLHLCWQGAGVAVVLLTNRTWPDRKSQLIRQVRPAFHDSVRKVLEIM